MWGVIPASDRTLPFLSVRLLGPPINCVAPSNSFELWPLEFLHDNTIMLIHAEGEASPLFPSLFIVGGFATWRPLVIDQLTKGSDSAQAADLRCLWVTLAAPPVPWCGTELGQRHNNWRLLLAAHGKSAVSPWAKIKFREITRI